MGEKKKQRGQEEFKNSLQSYLRSLQDNCRQRDTTLQATEVWLKVVGKRLFEQTRVLSCSSGVLLIGVKDFVVFQECTLFRERYLHQVCLLAAHLEIKKILVRMERGLSA